MQIKYHETLDIIDTTKLNCYQRCARKYLYSYILGWNYNPNTIIGKRSSGHLQFGIAWHTALEIIYKGSFSKNACEEAIQSFDKTLADYSQPNSYKTKDSAIQALCEYIKLYHKDNFDFTYIETSGSFPLPNNRLYTFKMDGIIKIGAQYYALEHKTASRIDNLYDLWNLSNQVHAYLTALYIHLNADISQIGNVIINAVAFKKVPEFDRIHITKTERQLNTWIDTVCVWFDCIYEDYEKLFDEYEHFKPITAFKCNYNACLDYGTKCPYYDLCDSGINVSDQHMLSDFTISHWNPLGDEK